MTEFVPTSFRPPSRNPFLKIRHRIFASEHLVANGHDPGALPSAFGPDPSRSFPALLLLHSAFQFSGNRSPVPFTSSQIVIVYAFLSFWASTYQPDFSEHYLHIMGATLQILLKYRGLEMQNDWDCEFAVTFGLNRYP